MVIRFLPSNEDEDICFEVGLTSWLCGPIDDDMIVETRWPPTERPASPLIKSQADADLKWKTFRVEVMRYYGEKSLS